MKKFNKYNIRQENEYVRAFLKYRMSQGDQLFFHPAGKSWVDYAGYYEQVCEVAGGWAMRPAPGAEEALRHSAEFASNAIDRYLANQAAHKAAHPEMYDQWGRK